WQDRSQVTGSFVEGALAFIKKAEGADRPFYVNVWPDDVHSPFFPPEDLRKPGGKHALYLGVLKAMDQQLAPLFDYVRNSEKLRDNTLILVCSDNGPEPGAGSAGPFRGGKTMLYEGGVRSPLIAWGPGLLANDTVGSVNKASVFSALDLAPSILAITGASTPAETAFDGVALPDVLLGKSKASRGLPLFFRRPPDRDSFDGIADLPDLAVRAGRWKLLCEYDGSDPQLYDLETDRSETDNVASAHPEIVANLTRQLLAWHQALPADNGATYRIPAAPR
ncbi:MAG: sulfatase-like hydrolase/transferase, partial [Chthoniobacteraceae bacterium]